MGPVVLALTVLAYVVVGHAAGLNWKTLLHWAGVTLQVAGILLAAVGISDVRREWTGLPGIRGRARQIAESLQNRAASFMWPRWNRAVERWPLLAKRLHLRIHLTPKHDGYGGVVASKLSLGGTVTVGMGAPPAHGTTEERLAWLERCMTEADGQLRNLHTLYWQEVRDRQAAADQEQAERTAEDRRTRDDIASLAGGGLRLQTWGVVCLLAGTIMTAIW